MGLLLDFSLKLLLSTGVHLGALVKRSVRSFFNNVFYVRNKLVVINLLSTLLSFRRITKVLSGVVSSRGKVMLIDSLYFAYKVYSFPTLYGFDLMYKARWVGGLLSNFKFVWRELSLDLLREPRYKHFTTEITGVTREMRRLPQVVFVTNRQFGYYAMKEATSLCIPVISLLNSNTASDWGLYWLPANDRSPISLKFFAEVIDALLVMVKLRRLVALKNRLNRKHLSEQLWLQPLNDVLSFVSTKLEHVSAIDNSVSRLNVTSRMKKLSLYYRNQGLNNKSNVKLGGLNRMSSAVARFWLKRWSSRNRKFLKSRLLRKSVDLHKQRIILLNSNKVNRFSRIKQLRRSIRNLKRNKMLNLRMWKRSLKSFGVRKSLNRNIIRRKRFKRMPQWKRRRLMKAIKWRKMKLLRQRSWKLSKRMRYLSRSKNLSMRFGRKLLRNRLMLRLKRSVRSQYFKTRLALLPARVFLNVQNFRVLSRFIKRCIPRVDSLEKVLFKIENYKLSSYFLHQDTSLKISHAAKLEYLDRLGYSELEKARVLRIYG